MLSQLTAGLALVATLLAPASCGGAGNTTSDPAPTCQPGQVSAHIDRQRIVRDKHQATFPADICASKQRPVYVMYVLESSTAWHWLQRDEKFIINHSGNISIAVNDDLVLATLFLVRDTKGDNCGRFWSSLRVGDAVYRKDPPKACQQLAHATT